MFPFYKFPYSNFHDLNLDWILGAVKELQENLAEIAKKLESAELVTVDEVTTMINTAIGTFTASITEVIEEGDAATLTAANTYSDGKNDELQEYLEDYADRSALDAQYMLNPFTGTYDDIRVVISDMIGEIYGDSTLSASEYDALDYTAATYDGKDLTATQYDFDAAELLV